MTDLDSYPSPTEDTVGRQLQGEAVIVLPSRGRVKVLNEVGARIWDLADGSRTMRDIAAALCAEYDTDQAQAELDVSAFLGQLAEQGAIRFHPQPVKAGGSG